MFTFPVICLGVMSICAVYMYLMYSGVNGAFGRSNSTNITSFGMEGMKDTKEEIISNSTIGAPWNDCPLGLYGPQCEYQCIETCNYCIPAGEGLACVAGTCHKLSGWCVPSACQNFDPDDGYKCIQRVDSYDRSCWTKKDAEWINSCHCVFCKSSYPHSICRPRAKLPSDCNMRRNEEEEGCKSPTSPWLYLGLIVLGIAALWWLNREIKRCKERRQARIVQDGRYLREALNTSYFSIA